MPYAIALHLLAAVIWVGGMFFAYIALRPAASALLEPPLRLQLWAETLKRFFLWVGIAIATLWVSGFWLIMAGMGGMKHMPPHIHIMISLGIVMMLIFGHIFFGPFRRLKQAVTTEDWELGASKLKQIRILVAINLCLGLIVVAVASGGRYF